MLYSDRLGLSSWTFSSLFKVHDFDIFDFMDFSNKKSIKYIELNDVFFQSFKDEYLDHLKIYAGTCNLLIDGIAVDKVESLSDTDDEKRTEAVSDAIDYFRVAVRLGASYVRFNTGDGSFEACVKSFSEIAETFSKGNIKVLVENHGGLSSSEEYLKLFFKETGHQTDNLYLLMDTGNPFDGNLLRLSRYTDVVHLKAYSCNSELQKMNTVISCLERDAYQGKYFIEYDGLEDGKVIASSLLEKLII